MAKHRAFPPSRRRVASFATLLILSMAALTGCSWSDKVTEPYKDSDRARTYDGPADVLTMPDGFNNVATKCGPKGVRIAVIYHGDSAYGAVSMILDPNCP